jgi:hypothetical protein
MARIGSSLVHIEGPQESEAKAMRRIRQLYKQKPQYIVAEIGTTAVGFAEKREPKPIKVPDIRHATLCYKSDGYMVRCNLPKRHKGPHSWERKPKLPKWETPNKSELPIAGED